MNKATGTGEPIATEVIALRYARRDARRSQIFIGGDEHDGPTAMDYFVWALRIGDRSIVVDTGFDREMARRRGRQLLADPVDLLGRAGYPADSVTDVIITHLHYDHAGNLERFPNATFHVQDAEVAYATGRNMCVDCLREPFEAEDVADLIRLVYAKRVRFHDGLGQVCPNVELHRIGGHTAGIQCVRVLTARGWLVLASDTSHYYENMFGRRPFPLVFNVGDMMRGHETLAALAQSRDHIIPGHDPLVMSLYPALPGELAGQGVRLDVAPVSIPVKT